MRPIPIEDSDLRDGYERRTSDPHGDDATGEVRMTDFLVGVDEAGERNAVKIGVDDDDLRCLAQHRHFWLVFYNDGSWMLEWPLAAPPLDDPDTHKGES